MLQDLNDLRDNTLHVTDSRMVGLKPMVE